MNPCKTINRNCNMRIKVMISIYGTRRTPTWRLPCSYWYLLASVRLTSCFILHDYLQKWIINSWKALMEHDIYHYFAFLCTCQIPYGFSLVLMDMGIHNCVFMHVHASQLHTHAWISLFIGNQLWALRYLRACLDC